MTYLPYLLLSFSLISFSFSIALYLHHPTAYLVSYWKQTKRTLANTNQLMVLHCEAAAEDSSHYSK